MDLETYKQRLLEVKKQLDNKEIDEIPLDARPKMLDFDYDKDSYVVVSYSRKDFVEVYLFLAHLYNEGYRFWYDNGMKGTEKWLEEYRGKFENPNCLGTITFFSDNYISDSTKEELEIIYNENGYLKRNVMISLVSLKSVNPEKMLINAQSNGRITLLNAAGILPMLTKLIAEEKEKTIHRYTSESDVPFLVEKIGKDFNIRRAAGRKEKTKSSDFMNRKTDQQRKFYYKTPIAILTIISIVLSFLDLFLLFRLVGDFSTSSDIFFDIAPKILFLIYILNFFKENKVAILLPTVFALLAIRPLFNVLAFIGECIFFVQRDDPLTVFPTIMIVIALIFVAVSASKGLSGKNDKEAMAIGIILLFRMYLFFVTITNNVYYIDSVAHKILFRNVTFLVDLLMFYLALFLFVLKNRTSPVTLPTLSEIQKMNRKIRRKIRTEKWQVDNLNPEQALRLLKEKLELGMITEEEYQSQRSEIISKL